jgi:hypothetical protein
MDQVVPSEDYPDYPIGGYPADQGDEAGFDGDEEEEVEEQRGKCCFKT